ncbi:MAG: HAD family hydrolase [Anaerolineales bacterium]|nr:HAD family hydrolase [Anaerolineales bacterium]
MRLTSLIFDLGNTLIYTPHALSWAVTFDRMRGELIAALQAAGYALDPAEFHARFAAQLRSYDEQRQADWVEYTTTYLLTVTLAELGHPAPTPAVAAQALAAYYRHSEALWRPVPALHETLRALQVQGYRLGLLSNAGDAENVQRLIDAADLRPYFNPLVISAAVGLRKPNPAVFERVRAAWGVPAAACVMIGDTLGADILGAQLAGMRHVWVTNHADHPANVAHRGHIVPEAEIPGLAELPALLAQWQAADSAA